MTRLAVILAAGLGTRLATVTGGAPKALVEVAGAPILGHLLAGCAAVGIAEVIVVTGHRGAAVSSFLARHAPLPCVVVDNPAHATVGNARSLACAREAIGGRSFLKLDGDLLVSTPLLAEMAARDHSTLAVDRRVALDAEAMKVELAGDRVTAIGKHLDRGDGESIGLERIDARDLDALMAALAETEGYYEDAYAALIARGLHLAAHAVRHPWVEIDDPIDLARAEAMGW